MNNCMAVCTERNKVSHWIDNLFLFKFGNGFHVMYMNKALRVSPIGFLKVKTTCFA